MVNERMSFAGESILVLRDENGKIKETRHVSNLVVTGGFDFVCAVMGNTASQPEVMGFIAVGSSDSAPTAGDTELGNEFGDGRVGSAYGHTATESTFYSTATYGAGVATGAITESGMFNDSSAGTMLCMATFDVINKGSSDSLEVTWKITVT